MKSQAPRKPRTLLSLVLFSAIGAAAGPAVAQPKVVPPAPGGQPPMAPPVVGQPQAAAPAANTGLSPIAPPPAQADPIAAALAPHPGGLTPEDVARTVGRNKHSVRTKQADLRVAAAKVDQAFVNFFPRFTVGASYTRLSPITAANLGTLVGYQDAPAANASPVVTVGPCSRDANGTPSTTQCLIGPKGKPAAAVPLTFPILLNSYSFTAQLIVPISDYVFRISQGYASATHNEKAARLSAEAEALQAGADAKIAFYNWVRAKGVVVVAGESIDQVKAHVEDAKKAFAVGLASKADVLRIEAQLAAAQQAQAESLAMASIVEEQLRTLLETPPGERLEIGTDVMNVAPTSLAEPLQALQDHSAAHRLEIRALDETIYSLREVQKVTEAGYLPRLDGFADATVANPNQRIFPASDKFVGTWDVGLKLSWTINDTFTAKGAVAESKARIAGINEQKGTLRDALRLEVASAYADAAKAPALLEAADRGMVSAEESLRVRRELFRNGKATSSELLDAEAELTTARLRRLDAHVGLSVARSRLDHATGRDVPVRPTNE